MKKYWKIWKVLVRRNYAEMTFTKVDTIGFVLAKLTRVAFLFLFLLGLLGYVKSVAGYSLSQVLVFYVLFNIIDSFTQALFRGVYHMPAIIHKGDFDFFLTKPASPLFLSLSWMIDFFDVFTLIPILALLVCRLKPSSLLAGDGAAIQTRWNPI